MLIQEFYNKDFYDDNRMCITAEITDSCNYNCKYCYNKKPRTNQIIDLDNLLNFILYQKKITNRNIEVTLIGGEPMLIKSIVQFVKKLLDNNIWITCFSNFSVEIEKYQELLAYNKKFEFILTWHSENKDFLNKLLQLKSYYKLISLSIMYEHFNIDLSINIFNAVCKEVNLKNIILSKITNVVNYTEEYTLEMDNVFEKINKNKTINTGKFILKTLNAVLVKNNLYIDKNKNPFIGWSCDAGKKLIYITTNGNIYPCVAMINPNNIIGNINYNINIKNKKIQICLSQYCCNYEVKKINVFNKNIIFNT